MSRVDIVYRPGAIGDALLALPALAALRSARHGVRLVVIAHPAVGEVVTRAGLADVFIGRDDPRADALFAGSPHAVRDAFGPVAGAVLWGGAGLEAAARNLRSLGAYPLVLAPSRPTEGSSTHVAQYLLDSLAPYGVTGAALAWPGLTMAGNWPGPVLSWPVQRGPLVVIHPGSGSARKNWPPERFAAVASTLQRAVNARIVLVLGPADQDPGRAFAAAMAEPFVVLEQPPLVELASLLARSALYLGNDSGPSHLAGLSGAPTLVLFGPTDPALWHPLGPRVRVLPSRDLAALAVEEVVEQALALLVETRS